MKSHLTEGIVLYCTPRALSPQRIQLMNVLYQHQQRYGYSPTVREMAGAMRFSSHSTVQSHLEVLIDNGYLRRRPGRARSWSLTAKGRQMLSRCGRAA